jgi:hypothetical protein
MACVVVVMRQCGCGGGALDVASLKRLMSGHKEVG